MKAINLLIVLISFIGYSQSELPLLTSEKDTVMINGNILKTKKLWIQSIDDEIFQRYKIENLELKLSSLSDVTSRIDQTSGSIFQINREVNLQKDLRIKEANRTIETLTELTENMNNKLIESNQLNSKLSNSKNFWRTTTLITTIAAFTATITLAVSN